MEFLTLYFRDTDENLAEFDQDDLLNWWLLNWVRPEVMDAFVDGLHKGAFGPEFRQMATQHFRKKNGVFPNVLVRKYPVFGEF